MALIKRVLYKNLSLKNYLRVLQRSYFFLYRSGILRFQKNYRHHYFVKQLIHPGDTVIDIGANLGYYTFLFAKWTGAKGKVIAVEPIPVFNEIFNELAGTYQNVVLYPYALGKESKVVTMSIPLSGGYFHTGLSHVADNTGNDHPDQIQFEVQMVRPSELFLSMEKIDYIKCDSEGYELNILTEMESVLRKHKPVIQVEIALENFPQLNVLLTDLGYERFVLRKGRLIKQPDLGHFDGDSIYMI